MTVSEGVSEMARFAVDLPDPHFDRLLEAAKAHGVTLHEEAAARLREVLESTEPTTVALVLGLGRQLRLVHAALAEDGGTSALIDYLTEGADESAAPLERFGRCESERVREVG
jgi:hypothetical protein